VKQDPLDVHYALDNSFALCRGNRVPRVPCDHFVYLGEVLSEGLVTEALASAPPGPRRYPWQRCAACVDLIKVP
jgi:hypothetical protein